MKNRYETEILGKCLRQIADPTTKCEDLTNSALTSDPWHTTTLDVISQTVIQNMDEALFMVDKSNRIFYVNSEAEKLINCDLPTVKGSYVGECFDVCDRYTGKSFFCRDVGNFLADLGKETQIFDDVLFVSGNRSRRRVQLKIIPITSQGEEPTAFVYLVKDYTVYRLMEDHIIKLQRLQSVSVFIGGIAHDFNNILTSIMGNLALANLSTDKLETLRERISSAEDNCERAKELSMQLLNYLRDGIPNKRKGAITEVIEDTASFVSHGSNVTLEFNFEPGIYAIDFDPVQISQVISNIVINSIQAMPLGGKISISCRNVYLTGSKSGKLKEGSHVKVTIADHGRGIAEKDIKKIFDPFFTTKENGYGLGLASCKSIIQNHNGSINVQSRESEGTVFEIFFPASSEINLKRIEGEDSTKQLLGRGSVLVMDSNPSSIKVLNILGLDTDVVLDNVSLIEHYSEKNSTERGYQFVIIDGDVYDFDESIKLLLRLKTLDSTVKVVIASEKREDLFNSSLKEHGFVEFIEKPYKLDEIFSVLAKINT